MQRNQKIIEIWNQEDGLSDRVIYAVLEDLNGNIWVKHKQRNNMINPQTKTVNKYSEADGLQGLNLIRQLVPMILKAICGSEDWMASIKLVKTLNL